MHPYGEVITVLRSTGRNKWGDKQHDVSHQISNVAVHPAKSEDLKDFGSSIDTSRDGDYDYYIIYMPLGSDIMAGDRIELMDDPDLFSVYGRPRVFRRNPITGDPGGVVAVIDRVSA